MATKYIVHNVSNSNVSVDVFNSITNSAQRITIEPGIAIDLVLYAGTIESARDCHDVYRFKRANVLNVIEA